MRRSQSTPGLGKGCNPLQGYLVDSRTMLVISPEEEEDYWEHIENATAEAKATAAAEEDKEIKRKDA